jgi:hypothetical protein
MIETTTKCDICKQTALPGMAMLVMRIDLKMHDLCEKCYGTISKLLAGTGRPVQGLFTQQEPLFFSPLNPANPAYLGNQIIGLNTTQNIQNADMAGIPGGLQYTITEGSPVYANGGVYGVSVGQNASMTATATTASEPLVSSSVQNLINLLSTPEVRGVFDRLPTAWTEPI